MERASFLNFIQQKNSNCDLKKLSVKSISSTIQQKTNQITFNVQSSSINSQMPAFINRKVKNLKPYTNHFKRFNIQTTKIPKSFQQKGQKNKEISSSANSKNNNKKYQFLKELGFPNQICCIDTNKMPQISVYHQFLEKTNSTFSNIIQNFNKTNFNNKKSSLVYKEDYQRQLKRKYEGDKININKQRKSLGSEMKDEKMKRFQETKSQSGKKSSQNFIKTDEVFIKSQKVCIIPQFSTLQKSQNNHKFIFAGTGAQAIDSAKYHKKQQKIISAGKQKEQIQQNTLHSNSGNKIKLQTKAQNKILDINEVVKSDIRIKVSPQKNNFKSITSNGNINNVKIQKHAVSTPLNKLAKQKQQKKSKRKIQITTQADTNPLPTNITAYSFIVFQPSFSRNSKFKLNQDNLRNTNKVFNNSRILASLNCKTAVQIASLTKIMTFLLSIQICQKFNLNSQNEKVRIGKFQSTINGTSAQINEGQFYTVEQLYYGLMLPSGNDASLALAIWGGKKLLINQIKEKQAFKKKNLSQQSYLKGVQQLQIYDDSCKIGQRKITLKKKKCYERFILEMNKKARVLSMTKTTYANSHGLSNNLNKSCAFDLCILCQYAMLNQKFKKVVSTVEYSCQIVYQIMAQQTNQQKQQPKMHLKQGEQQNQNNLRNMDDIQHQNQHYDQQSIEDLSQKQTDQSTKTQNQSIKNSPSMRQIKQPQVKKQIVYGQRIVKWQNTHKLLEKQEYVGIKTGITNTAGPCLASCIRTLENRYFIIIVLNSKKLNNRFKDTQILKKWLFKKQKLTKSKQSKLQNYNQQQDKIQNMQRLLEQQQENNQDQQNVNQEEY